MRNLCNLEYYKAWKAKLYCRVKFFTAFSYRIFNGSTSGDCAIVIPANDSVRIRVRLRRGPAWYMIGVKTGYTTLAEMQDIYLTIANNGGYKIMDRVPVSIVSGTVQGRGDSFIPCNWQWEAGEDIFFTIENTSAAPKTFRGVALGKNIGMGA